eukprot:306038_1
MFPAIGRFFCGPTDEDKRQAKRKAKEAEDARQREAERQKRAHDAKMAELKLQAEKMKDKKAQVKYWRQEKKDAEAAFQACATAGTNIVKELKTAEREVFNTKKEVDKQEADSKAALAVIKREVEAAQAAYKENHDKIRAAIDKTNVGEGSIPQFLNLINSGLIVGTLNDTAKREELNAKLAAFGELIARRVQTTMLLDTYFIDGMAPLIPFLNEEQYKTMDSILCDDEKEFNEIVVIIEKGIANTNAENKAYNEGLAAKKEEEKVKRTKLLADAEPIAKKIAELQQQIDEVNVKKAASPPPPTSPPANPKDEDFDKELRVLTEKINPLKAKKRDFEQEIKDIDEFLESGPRKDLKPIRTKQKKGGPLFQKLKKLCMRDFAESDKGWSGKLKAAGTDPDDEVPLSKYFKGKMAKWAEYLVAEDYETMDLILCDEDDEFEAIVDIIEAGIANDGGKPMKRGTSGSKTRVMKDLESFCMRNQAKEGWIKDQDVKKVQVTRQLSEVSPLLGDFFGAVDEAVTQGRKMLEFSSDYNQEQKLAIKEKEKNEKELQRLKAITAPKTDDDSKSSGVVESFDAECENTVAKTGEDLEPGDKLDQLKVARDDSDTMVVAAIVKLHVVESLRPKFANSLLPDTMKTGYTLATDVEHCSLQIFQSHGAIRKSVLMAQQLLEFKPAAPGPKSAPFWEVIVIGIDNIFKNYIQMVKIAAKYFAFFPLFKSGFEHYKSCEEIAGKGKAVNLTVATEYLLRDVRKFTEFTSQMQVIVDKLTQDAESVIGDCLKQTAGASEFEKAQKARKVAKKRLLAEETNLRTQKMAINSDLDDAIASYNKALISFETWQFKQKMNVAQKERAQERVDTAVMLAKSAEEAVQNT